MLSQPSTLAPQLRALGLPPDLPMAALAEDSAMLRDLRAGRSPIAPEIHRRDLLAAAEWLLLRHPEVGALVLECANFPPHSRALSAAFGLPVFDMVSMVNWLHAALYPDSFL